MPGSDTAFYWTFWTPIVIAVLIFLGNVAWNIRKDRKNR